jgi:hypothetical protein
MLRSTKRRGQIIIMVGVVLSLLILSVAVSVYMGSLQYSQFQKSTYSGAVLNLSNDFTRVLTNILGGTTISFNGTADITTPRAWALANFTDWVAAIQNAYTLSGIQSDFFFTNDSLSNGLYTDNSLVKLYWYTPNAISAISAGYKLNLTGEGLYGAYGNTLVLLNTTINDITSSSSSSQLNITALEQYGIPDSDLTRKNFQIDYFNNITNLWSVAKITSVRNYGGGNYLVNFTGANGAAIPSPYYKYLVVWVLDNRGILTESYSYTGVQYVLSENAIPASNPKPYQVYVMESISNGSIIWFNHLLHFKGNSPIPIPIPPVKQLRVYTNTTGSFKLVPSQVEVWTSNYKLPTLQFADWRTRFGVGDKLVYDVSFAGKNVNTVAVNITWLADADAPPPAYLLNYSQTANEWIVDNLQYSLGLVTNSNLINYEPGTNWIDYNLQVNSTFPNGTYNPNGYHIEYTLFGYDAFNFQGGVWFPAKLPWGPGPNEGWTIIPGPVRAVAYRSSDWSYSPPTNTYYCSSTEPACPAGSKPAEFNFTQIILIPYNVSYFESYFSATAVKDVTFSQQYVELVGMIGGTEKDFGTSVANYRPNYAAVQTLSPSYKQLQIINGSYTNTPSFHIYAGSQTTANQIGWWVSEFGAYRGQAIFIDNASLNTLRSSKTSAYWFWTTSDGSRRVAEYDYAYWNPNNGKYVIPAGTQINYDFAGWIYNVAGSVSNQYSNSNLWANGYLYSSSTGVLSPSTYYTMFLTAFYPLIINSSVTT